MAELFLDLSTPKQLLAQLFPEVLCKIDQTFIELSSTYMRGYGIMTSSNQLHNTPGIPPQSHTDQWAPLTLDFVYSLFSFLLFSA